VDLVEKDLVFRQGLFLVRVTGVGLARPTRSVFRGSQCSTGALIHYRFPFNSSPYTKQKIGNNPIGLLPILVGLFITDLLKGKEPRWTKHIPKGPKMLVFTRNFETRKEYDYGKVHH
jgi:hypothetical protein